jgi:hypothetical protein
MTEQEFDQGLYGDITRTKDGKTRLCYLVAEGLSQRARERQDEGRRDIASRLRWLASQLNGRGRVTKTPLAKLAKDIQIVRERLVDGEPVADWDSAR